MVAHDPTRSERRADDAADTASAALDGDADGGVSVRTLLAYDGPAALFDGDGRVLDGNAAAQPLLALTSAADATLLRTALKKALTAGVPVVQTARGPDQRPQSLDLTLIPLPDGQRVVVLARDTSLDASLRTALAESRGRFKDFVELSSDFAWETGPDGRLAFVSFAGALGREARDLVGSDPLHLLDTTSRPAGRAVFATRAWLRDIELWARDSQGRRVRLLASAMPVIGPDGTWAGARGICRDITEQHVRDLALRRAQERDRVRGHIVRTFRDQVDVEGMLTVAAEALAHGVGAVACQILRRPTPGHRQEGPVMTETGPCEAVTLGGAFGPDTPVLPMAVLEQTLTDVSAGDGSASGASSGMWAGTWEGPIGDHAVLAVGTSYRQHPNGAVVLWRAADRGGWTADDRALILDVAGQVGIANEQIVRYETIMDMSRTDPLTGLLNRRAFMTDIERRRRRMERAHRSGALLYVDLDNFKRVNDRQGHARGDQVLVMVAEILSSRTRPTDLVARLGGDEFAVWLEDTDAMAACHKADDFLSGSALLGAFSADADHPLAMSVGIAILAPGLDEPTSALCERADSAMYAAKQAGKGRFHLAEPPSRATMPGAGASGRGRP